MAIHLYAAKIKKENEIEYVDNFVDFIIPKASILTNEGNTNNITNDYLEYDLFIDVTNGNSNTDEIPTNIITMIREVLELNDDFTNYKSLVGTTINLFLSPNLNDKLNCSFYIDSYNSYRSTLNILFGDVSRNITMKLPFVSLSKQDDSYYNYKCFIVNPKYDGDNIFDLLNNVREIEDRNFKNKLYTKYMNTVSYAPFYLYQNDTPLTNTNFNSFHPSGFWNYETLLGYFNNLSRYANWYTMITGEYFYGNPFSLEFDGEYKGLKKFDLGVTISPNVLDEGLEFTSFENTSPKNYYTSRGFSYYNVGHDITYFFDTTNDDEEIIYLKNGYMKKYKKNGVYHYQINNSDLGIDIYCGGNDSFQSNNISFGPYDNTLKGLYIFVNPNFATIPVSSWLRLVPLDLTSYNYEDCPLFFASTGFTYISKESTLDESIYGKTSYVNWENIEFDKFYSYYAVPGIFTNYRYEDNDKTSNIVSNELECNYTFWQNFISGIFDDNEGINIGGGSIGGGISGTGGGNGNFNDASFGIDNVDDVVNMNYTSLRSTKFLNAYVLDNYALDSLARQCWDTNWSLDDLAKYFGNNDNPMEAIIGIKYYSCSIPRAVNTSGVISLCGKNFTVTSELGVNIVKKDIENFDFGSIDIEEYYGNYVDYDETNISIMLPYVGVRELNTREIMGGTIHLNGLVDFIDGSITYYLSLTKNNVTNIINSWRGVCSYEFPITNYDLRDKTNALINGAMSSVSSIAGGALMGGLLGGAPGAIVGGATGAMSSITSTAGNTLSAKPTINKQGNFAGSRTSINKPYLIIERPKQSLPENFNKVYGYTSNIYSKFISLSGFTVISQVHLENMGYATSEEVDEIETLLKSGVIF